MTFAQMVSALALRRLNSPVSEPAGSRLAHHGAHPANGSLTTTDEHVLQALSQANERAWTALEIALAGEGLLHRIQACCDQGPREDLKRQVEAFLQALPLADLCGTDRCRQCRQELRAAREAGLLTGGPLGMPELTRLSSFLDRFTDPHDPLQCEWQALEALGDELDQAGYPNLKPVLGLRTRHNDPFLVVAVVSFFCQTPQGDPDQLANGASGPPSGLDDVLAAALDGLNAALEEHGRDLEARLADLDNADVPLEAGARADAKPEASPLQLGMAFYHRGEYDRAVAHLTSALQLDPTDALAYAHRGDANRLRCEYDQAVADYTQAISLSPSNALFYIHRGIVYQLKGDLERAVADCSAALQLDPNNAIAYHNRGKCNGYRGAHDRAIDDLTRVIQLDPRSFWAYYHRGKAHSAKRMYEHAITDFSQVLRQNPNHALAYLHRGCAYRLKGDYDRAIQDLTVALRLHPQNVLAYTTRGDANRLKDNKDQAIRDYSKALRFTPENGELYRCRGIVHRLKGDHGRGITDLTHAIRLDPADAEAYYHRGQICATMGDHDQALADYSEALRINPRHVQAYVGRALAHDRLGHFSEVIDDCGRALQVNAKFAPAHYIRGTAYLSRCLYGQAITDLTRAIALDPGFPLAYNDRGLAYTHLAKLDAALADFEHAIRLDPRNPVAHATRGFTQFLKGAENEASANVMTGLQLSPRLVLSCWTRGWVPATRAEYAQAIVEYVEGRQPQPQEILETDIIEHDESAELLSLDLHQRPGQKTQERPSLKTNERFSHQTQERASLKTQQAAALTAPRPAPQAEPARAAEAESKPLEPTRCPICEHHFTPTETIPATEGRVRCPVCKASFVPRPAAAGARPSPKSKPPRTPWEFDLKLPRWAVAGLAASLLLGVAIYFLALRGRAVASAPLPEEVTATAFWREYSDNPEAANDKYAGHQVSLTGKVAKVTASQDGARLLLQAPRKAKWFIECAVADKSYLKNVQTNREVMVIGECQPRAEAGARVQLTDCKVYPKNFDYE